MLSNIGVAYFTLSKYENKEANIDSSISCTLTALKINSLKNNRRSWANAEKNLASPYLELMTLNTDTGNIYSAINCLDSSLKYYTLEEFPNENAEILANKAVAFRSLGQFTDNSNYIWKTINYERSKKYNNEALKTLLLPSDRDGRERVAQIRQNIGSLDVIYSDIIKNKTEKKKTIKEAITYLNMALDVFNLNQYPLIYASINDDFGNAFTEFASIEDKRNNLYKAENYYNEAFRIFIEENHPIEYAGTIDDYGDYYKELATFKDKIINLSKADSCYKVALRIYTEKDQKGQCKRVREKLDNLYK